MHLHRPSTRALGATAAVALILGAGAGAEAATAKKKKPKTIVRTVSFTYQGGCGIDGAVVQATPGTCVAGDSYNLTRRPGEKYISVSVKDGMSPDVPAILWLGTGVNAPNQPFCTTIKNFVLPTDSPQLDLFEGADTSCAGSATTGTIKVTFSSKPIK